MTDLFHKILVYLHETHSLHQDKDITQFLKNHLSEKQKDPNELQNIARTLGHLIGSSFIRHFSVPMLGQHANGSVTNNLDERPIIVNLELLGYNYISNKISQDKQEKLLERQTVINEQSGKSVIDTNKLASKIAKQNINLGIITLAFVAVSAYATYQTYRISDETSQRERLKESQIKQQTDLNKQIIEKNKTLVIREKIIDSLFHLLKDKKK